MRASQATPIRHNFAPRLGMAWQPGFLKAAVIRVGTGIYYTEFLWIVAPFPIILSPPFGDGIAFNNPLTKSPAGLCVGRKHFPSHPLCSVFLTGPNQVRSPRCLTPFATEETAGFLATSATTASCGLTPPVSRSRPWAISEIVGARFSTVWRQQLGVWY